MRDSIRRVVTAVLALAFVASLAAAPARACDGSSDSDAQSAPSGK
ncbi:MAG: hypothetical protein U0802_19265 [Candidatus Binatia bacterium]